MHLANLDFWQNHKTILQQVGKWTWQIAKVGKTSPSQRIFARTRALGIDVFSGVSCCPARAKTSRPFLFFPRSYKETDHAAEEGATACMRSDARTRAALDRKTKEYGGFLMPGTGPTKKIKTCGPLVFNLPSPNANLLEYTFLFTWHLGFRLGKSRNLPSELCKLVGDALGENIKRSHKAS